VPETLKASTVVFRSVLTLGIAAALYGIVTLVVVVVRARAGGSNLDEVAGVMGITMLCIVAAVALTVVAFVARMVMRRGEQADA
jgi:hypothetical protein